MHRRHAVPRELLTLAARQGGVVSREQALAFGLGPRVQRRLVDQGSWRRITSGLFLVHDIEPDWMAMAWGGVLLGGQHARLGGRAAAHLWGLVDPPPRISLWVPHDRVLSGRDWWDFRRERPGVRDPRSFGDPPRLGIADTVLDLCNEVDADTAVNLVLKSVQSRRTTPRHLSRALAARTKVRHRKLIADMVEVANVGAETALEVRYLHDVEEAHGLPRGRRQMRAGWASHIQDVRYDPYRLVVELDGHLGHEDMGRFRDMDRDNLATVAGHPTLRFGWPDVTRRPCRAAAQVCTVLLACGWHGHPRRCSRCRALTERDWWV